MQIDPSLFQLYLIKNRRLPLGKMGMLTLEKVAAAHEYTHRVIHPGREVLSFSPNTDKELLQDFEDFAVSKGVDRKGVGKFFEQIREQLSKHREVVLEGIGRLSLENNVYKLTATDRTGAYFAAVPANAVIHEGEVHEVTVGEQVRTSTEMKEMLFAEKPKDYWWVYALILVVVAIAAILYYVYGDQWQ